MRVPYGNRPVRFLLVEDDRDHAALMIRGLSRTTVANEVAHVTDGIQALAYLRREGIHSAVPTPDVILLDLNLPKLDGHEVLAKIRADPNLRRLAVVMMTTSDAAPDRARAYENQVNSYIVKPMDFGQFRELVQNVATYWGVWNRPAASDA